MQDIEHRVKQIVAEQLGIVQAIIDYVAKRTSA